MRYIDLLEGTLDTYLPMFNQLKPFMDDEQVRNLEKAITGFRDVLKRRDRITWALSWYRLGLAYSLLRNDTDNKELSAVVGRYKRELGANDGYEASSLYPSFTLKYWFEHILSLTSRDIQEYRFDNRVAPPQLRDTLVSMEQKWIATRKSRVELQDGDEKLIDFHNGWAWFKLARGSCKEEGDAMGHCGNVPSEKKGDRIISLRKQVSGGRWSPQLTFILHENGYLGEMKGRGNAKPVARYHSMIAALLEHPDIEGIIGGGYEAMKNFHINDMSEDEANRLKALKPGLQELDWLLQHDPVEGRRKLAAMAGEERVHEIKEMRGNNAILEQYSSLERYIQHNAYGYDLLFDKIETKYADRTIRGHDGKYYDGDAIYEKFKDEYYESVFRECVHYIVDYQLDGVWVDILENGNVEVVVPIQDIIDLANTDENERPISGSEELTSTRDYSHNTWEDFRHADLDHIGECLMKVYLKEKGKWFEKLLDAIEEEFIGERNTPEPPHPDQLSFDFDA